MTREQKTWLVSQIVLGGFVAAVAFHYSLGVYRGQPYPANTFLFDPRDVARDFINIYRPVQAGDPYSSVLSVYFPFTFLPLWLVRFAPVAIAFGGLVALFLYASVAWMSRSVPADTGPGRGMAVATLGLLAYPVLFCLDRGNLEMLVFVLLVGFLTLFERRRWMGAAALLAGATAMKLYPGVFVVLLLARRHYRAAAATVVLTLALSLGSAALYPGGVLGSLQQLSANLAWFKTAHVLRFETIGFNVSYFNVLKLVSAASPQSSPESLGRLLFPYTVACLAAFAVLAGFMLRRGQSQALWKQVALLVAPLLLFPEVSSDYKLVHLLLPLGLFLRAEPESRDPLYCVLFGLLLIPKTYVWIAGTVSIAVVINPLLLTILAAYLLADRSRVEPGTAWQDTRALQEGPA